MCEKAISPNDISRLLHAWNGGNSNALDELLPLVYNELRRQARRLLRNERPNHTLQSTALIHEAYLNLVEQNHINWQNREHFFAISANVMRRILVNYANARRRKKRGGAAENLELDEMKVLVTPTKDVDLLALDEALTRLAKKDEQQARIVELRYFSGLTIEETASILGISKATIKRDWKMTKAWLYREISVHDGIRKLAKG
jgi:RNA polymerase sigma factor (TIGR02999 family)